MKAWSRRARTGFGGDAEASSPSPSPSLRWLCSWVNCSVNSVKDSSMVSVRGTDREKRRLKFFILFMISRDQAAGPEKREVRRASRENKGGAVDPKSEFQTSVFIFPASSATLHWAARV